MITITRDQLVSAGVVPDVIDHWVRRGRLHPRHRGVYSLTPPPYPPFSAEMAAVLAVGANALLSHASAAFVWGIRPAPEGTVDVTVVGRQARHRAGIRIHRVSHLLARDVRRSHDIPITSPARALLDIAPTLDDRELELAVHEAFALKLLTATRLMASLKDYPCRRGSARLAELARQSRSSRTRSGGEEQLLRLIRRSRMPHPQVNAQLGGWNLDFYWPEHRLVVEVDGIDFHSSRVSVERDHRKDLELRRRGIDVLRFVGRQVRREPELLLVTIARELALREPPP